MIRRALYRSFRVVYAVETWVTARFTKAGLLALAGLGAAGVVGVDTNRTLAYQAFAFLASLLAFSAVSSLFFRGRFSARRTLPRFGTAGQPLRYRLVVENDTERPQGGLLLREGLADPRPTFEEFIRGREPGEERRNWFDRKVGYQRWMWLVSRNQQALIAEQAIPTLPPRAKLDLSPEIVPLRRGHLRFTGATLARPDALGLFKAFVTLPGSASVLILPKRYPLPRIQLPGTRKYQQGGVALTSSVGDSEEFVSLRDYRPGDSLRRVHWKSWARLGKPIVKEYQDEFFVRHALVLDTFQAVESSEPFEEAVAVAASFACAVETQESLLDLMFVGPEAYCFTSGRGLGHTERMLEILASVGACTDRPFGNLHRLVLDRHASLSGCIAILLAWDEERQGLVRNLEALGIPTLTLVIGDPAAAASHGGPRMHWLETGKIAEGLARL